MAIFNPIDRHQYAGGSTAYPFEFSIADASEIKVIDTDGSGVETILALDTDYTVTGLDGGTVTLAAAPPADSMTTTVP